MDNEDNDPVQFTDLFRPSMARASRTVRRDRMEICRGCDHYSKMMSTCGICGCVMPLKTTLAEAECPAGLWGKVAPPPRRQGNEGRGTE